jgi:two-component system CheB/CheR fusion protein
MTPAAALNEATSHHQALEKVAPPSVRLTTHRVMHLLSTPAASCSRPAGLTGDIVDLVRPELPSSCARRCIAR